MTTGIGPYETPDAALIDTDPSADVLEITMTVSEQTVDIGGGVMVNAETINGAIPAPTLRLNVDDTVIVRLVNDLPHPSGIHWHGIELQNAADGTPVTQNGVAAGPFSAPSPASPTGGTYLYKFKVPRPGIYWYHPHHHHSTNRVFRGTYGMIIVTDPNEAPLITSGVIPGAADTEQLVLSDITVCKAPGMNDASTYVDPTTLPAADRPEWLSGATAQLGPTPVSLCEIPPAGQAIQEDGSPAPASYAAGDVPNIQRNSPGRTVEGQTVLTNGVNVGGRAGMPAAPGALAAGAVTRPVLSGQGVRLQITNCAHLRYFRFRLTTSSGAQVPLIRIGGEGGLLDNAVEEGGLIGGFDTRYDAGEILLPPASRADVVAVIPAGEPAGSVLTLWTRDFQRTGPNNPGGWAQLPTVPVMHLNVTGAVAGAPSTIAVGTPLRASIPGAAVEALPAPAPGVELLDPSTFSPPKIGQTIDIQDIQLTAAGGAGVNGTPGSFSGFSPYTSAPHIPSSRYAEQGNVLEFTVSNTSAAQHPFHLHGFSFQPISLSVIGAGGPPAFTWPYREFVDVTDIPAGHALTLRVRLEDRPLADGVTMGGVLGRWLFHCHIFFHAHSGMISELVVTDAGGSEKPNVDVNGSWAYAPLGGTATRTGTYSHPDGDAVTLTASLGTVTDDGGGTWSWQYTAGMSPLVEYVYITATDSAGRQDQAVFRLKIGAPDDGSDNGDPHIHTVDGKRYDFQAVGEFTLLRDREGMEIQTRQTPVQTANPITDPYSGLTACVSVNTAVAARVGSHRIAYQPAQEGSRLQFFVDGKPANLSAEGIDLDGHFVSAFDANSATGLRVDYTHHAVLTVTPYFWNSHGVWLLNVRISHTQADTGLMGRIPDSSWLPALPSGATVGPMPEDILERYITLYRTFADAWRVTDESSLFVYAPGTSTTTFTDKGWPAEQPPCELKPQFEITGVSIPEGIDLEAAKQICQAVTEEDLHQDCVFDVATTGDEVFAQAYELAQDLRLRGTAVQIVGSQPCPGPGDSPGIVATVIPLRGERPTPAGTITFLADGEAVGQPVKLDERGRACLLTNRLTPGEHKIQARYTSGGEVDYHSSASPILRYTVEAGQNLEPGCVEKIKDSLLVLIMILLGILALIIALIN
jgi:FtsP/CotA-like multicopper oxidase with cupredoxin domain